MDLDTFFVSVERLLNPELVGKPVVVGALPGKRGVVTACSYEVRELGVRSGMPIAEAYRLAPDAVYIPPQHREYSPRAREVKAILERYTPVVRTASIDEFFLDFSGCEGLHAAPEDWDGDATVERIARDTGLPASAGIGASRAIAKMASGAAKPAGVLMVARGEEAAFISPLPVRKFPGIGPVTEGTLLNAGVTTLGQLISLPPGPLRMRFGRLAAGVKRAIDPQRAPVLGRDRPAFREHDPDGVAIGSISNERTFSADVGDVQAVREQLAKLAERVCWRARSRDTRARTVTLKLRYNDFDTRSRSQTITATNDETLVRATVLALFERANDRKAGVRLVGVALSNLVGADKQLPLPLDSGVLARPAPGEAISAIRDRFGYDAVRVGAANDKSTWIA